MRSRLGVGASASASDDLTRLSFLEKGGAAEGTRTPDPIITNDVLYQLSYSGFLDPTMALLVLLVCLEPFGFASHSCGDPLITNFVVHFITQARYLERSRRDQHLRITFSSYSAVIVSVILPTPHLWSRWPQ